MSSLASIERRLAALERQKPSGPMLSTAFGGGNSRPYQVGFPAKLTGTFDATTGYPWEQLVLNVLTPAVEAAAAYPNTGTYAFTVNNDETLDAPTEGWMEVDPQANGYIFTPVASAGPSAVSAWKEPVRVATTTAGTLASSFENGDTVDGVTLATGDRILIKNQSSGAENGIYTVNASGAPTRATDCDAGAEFVGATVRVQQGTLNGTTVWECVTTGTITVGSTATVWQRPFLATPDMSGDVSTAAQSWRGKKTFCATGTVADGSIEVEPTTGTSYVTIRPNGVTAPSYGAQVYSSSGIGGVELRGNGGGIQSLVSIGASAFGSGLSNFVASTIPSGSGSVLGYSVGIAGDAAAQRSGIGFSCNEGLFDTGDILYAFYDPLSTGTPRPCFRVTGTVSSDNLFWVEYGLVSSGRVTVLGGGIEPPTLTDAAAANNTIYYSSTAGKLVYKDAGGVVNALY